MATLLPVCLSDDRVGVVRGHMVAGEFVLKVWEKLERVLPPHVQVIADVVDLHLV